MPEWRLYRAVAALLRQQGLYTATQVTDPRASRVELDVVGFTPEMGTVHVVEVKEDASDALVNQCVDRLRYAPEVSGAVPSAEADRLAGKVEGAGDEAAGHLGVVAVDGEGAWAVREPRAAPEAVEPGRRNMLERVLREALAEGEAQAPGRLR